MASAVFDIDPGTGTFGATPQAVSASGATVRAKIRSVAGISPGTIVWTIEGVNNETVAKPTLTPSGVPLGQIVTMTVPAGGNQAFLIQCQVNGGPDVTGDANTQARGKAYVINGSGRQPIAFYETTEGEPTIGVAALLDRVNNAGPGSLTELQLRTVATTLTAALGVNGQKITGLGTPTAGTDATTKAYVDSVIGGGGGIGSATTADFVVPAQGLTVTVAMSTTGLVAGMPLWIQTAGDYVVASVTDSTHAVLTNAGSPNNAAAAATIGHPVTVVPAGPGVDLQFDTDKRAASFSCDLADLTSWVVNAGAGTLTAPANGAMGTVDGQAASSASRLFVRSNPATLADGVYYPVTLGSVSTKAQWKRAPDADSAAKLRGMTIFVVKGTKYGGRRFGLTLLDSDITLGTTPLKYVPLDRGPNWVIQFTSTAAGSTVVTIPLDDDTATDLDVIVKTADNTSPANEARWESKVHYHRESTLPAVLEAGDDGGFNRSTISTSTITGNYITFGTSGSPANNATITYTTAGAGHINVTMHIFLFPVPIARAA